jgi:hypothetical protein
MAARPSLIRPMISRPLLLSSALAAVAGPGVAQTTNPAVLKPQSPIYVPEQATQVPGQITPTRSMFARDRDIPVSERVFPGFLPQGLEAGWFRIFPQLGVTGEGISNVFENDERQHGDFVVALAPQLTAQYDSSQLIFDAYAKGEIDRFAQFHSENENQGVVGFDATRYLPGYSSVFAGGSYGVVALPRLSPESPVNAATPLRYTDGQADLGGAYEQNRVRLTGRFDLESLHFENGQTIGGGVLYAGDHDRTRYTGTVEAQYAISPATAVYVGGAYNVFDYRLPPPQVPYSRDSHGYEAFVGSNFEVTGLTKADVRIGYLKQDFDDRRLGGIGGLGVRGQLEYFPSRLTTVTFTVRRSVEDSGLPNTGGFLETGGSVAVDHEYRRYLMLNVKASYYDDEYRGISRHDGEAYFTAGATYLSTHHWNLKIAYEYIHQNSAGCDCSVDYDDHRAVATLTFQY